MRKEPLLCNLCPYATHYSTHFKDHMRVHSGEKPFKCTKCPASFTQRAHCQRHLLTHEPKKPHQRAALARASVRKARGLECCDHSRKHVLGAAAGRSARGKGRSFLQLWSVRENAEEAAETEGIRPRKFRPIFGSSITDATAQAKKSGMRKDPFLCNLCPYTTHYATHMKDHMRMHKGEKPFKCTKCPAAFTQAANCRRHVRTHDCEKTQMT
ncbi:uncharacterized protein LOC142592670 [Dermacentor variabilis]|uniref:uncharacterized protein LOC142592670 n=1 Tax=Dermacentor variabilis TaxID=34621 RepID=UPI003F5B2773